MFVFLCEIPIFVALILKETIMIQIARFTFNPLGENTYLLWDDTKECIIVDAGNSTSREHAALDKVIADGGLKPLMAVNTHGHFDHALGIGYIKEHYNIPFALHSDDNFLIDSADLSASVFGLLAKDIPAADIDLKGQESISFGNSTLQLIHTPGHTPGHICLYDKEGGVLLTGDTLFRESIGRTDLPGGDYSWIMRSIIDKIIPLGDEVKILPGHGESSTIGHESLYNPFVTEVINGEINC